MAWKIPPGVIPNLLTPMTDDYGIDEETLRKLTEFHAVHPSTSSLCVGPNLSDSHNLSLEERKRIGEIVVDQAAGRVGVMVSVASSSLDQSLDLAAHAADIGADAIYAVPPYNWILSDDELFEYFVTVAESVPISLIGYHIPSWQAGAGLNPEFVVRLAERLDNFVGIKDASFNLKYYSELVALIADAGLDFEVSPSLEWFLLCYPLGARSSHSGIASFAPNLSYGLFESAAAGDWARARELYLEFGRLWGILYAGFPYSLKSAMSLVERPMGPMRPPLEPLAPETFETLRAAFDELGVLEREPIGW